MSIVLCNDKDGNPQICGRCKEQLMKNPDCGTDYYPTHIGIVLQKYCRSCGMMLPLVSERDWPSCFLTIYLSVNISYIFL